MRLARPSFVQLVFALALAVLAVAPVALASPGRHDGEGDRDRDHHHAAPYRDPLVPMLHRLHAYFRSHEVNGVTMDSRYPIDPSEAIRMGVVSQLLGYTELAKRSPRHRFRREIRSRASFLAARLDSVRSFSPFDGMLGYSLVQAYEQTGDSTTLAAARIVINELEGIPTWQCVLNGGLMVAMATADWGNLTGDIVAKHKTTDILWQLSGYQNADGSFPHWCGNSEDIHYTGWMAEELVLLERMTGDPSIEPTLARMKDFLEARLDSTGMSHYEGPCPDDPTCVKYYDSRRSGCWYDYDTRGWTVEPAYTAQVLDHFHSPSYRPVMRFLLKLENRGTFSDKYDYIPPPDDPEYPWSIADTSVANMSINFWVLATALTGRGPAPAEDDDWLDQGDEGLPVAEAPGPGLPRGVELSSVRHVRRVDEMLRQGRLPAEFAMTPPQGGPAGPGGSSIDVSPAPREIAGAMLRVLSDGAPGACALRFTLLQQGAVRLSLYDPVGRRIRTLVAGTLGAGEHTVAWDGRDERGAPCPGGIYFARLLSQGRTRSVHVLRMP